MEKLIRKSAFCCALILIATLIIAVIPTEAEADIYNDTVRLHILANSDNEEDQRTKLLLRDFLLSEYREYLGEAKSKPDAVALISDILPEIENSANEYLTSIGCEFYASVSLSREWFDTREYEEFTLPQGYYTSLTVKIGDADGKNWWCVMYPPMCIGAASASNGSFSKEEEKLIYEGKRNIKFKALEVLSRVFK